MKANRSAMFFVLIAAAALRLWMQAAAMPPYAGLDEIYHVSRLAFVLREGRNPTKWQPSVPPYLGASIAGRPDALPAFGVIGVGWPEIIRQRSILSPDRPLESSDLAPYVTPNYEAQQPSLYYSFAAPMARLLRVRSALGELRMWRLFSVVCGVLVVFATAVIANRLFGLRGLIAPVLLISTPTWLTLVVRASNDALACAFLALALAMTFSAPRRWAGWMVEGTLWSLALATKLYAWPAAIALPLIWRTQQSSRERRVLVICSSVAAVVGTAIDLVSRTRNPLGLFAFDKTTSRSVESIFAIDYGQMCRVFIASAAWTSAQHWNALRPLAILLYLGPILTIIAGSLIVSGRRYEKVLFACLATAIAFGLAQAINAAGFIRQALANGTTLPAGGKEGWYWYALAPLFFATLFGLVGQTLPKVVGALTVAWAVGWDLLIHEGALFQDFAGLTHPGRGDWLFQWGPRSFPFHYAALLPVAVGPGTPWLALMRLLELAFITAFLLLMVRKTTEKTTPATEIVV